jgi:Ala-tRNA(Pro) deacylase
MPIERLKKFLDENNIKYVTIGHSPAFTAQAVAGAAGIPGKVLAKTVIINVNGKKAMAVLPASYKVDFNMLEIAIGAKNVELASENEFKDLFPDCEVGAMPPFGNLYDMNVYVAESLTDNEEIAFNACSHRELIKMAYKDYEILVKPKVIKFSFK